MAGYDLTQVAGLIHDATITGLTGPFYAVAKDGDGTELGYVYRVVMVDDSSLIDTTVSVTAEAAAAIATQVKADPPTVAIAAASIAEIAALDAVGIGSGGASEVTTTELSAFQGETVEQTITAYLADGTTPLDLSGLTLEIVWESSAGTFLAVIGNANITISGAGSNVVTFAYPSAVTRSVGTKIWSLRDAADASKVRLNGTLLVSKAAINTSD